MVREERPVMVFCSCGHEAIQLEYEEEDDLTYMSFWEYGHKVYKRSWKDRFKMIWKVLRTGTPYSDNVILNQRERRVLIEALEKHTPLKLNNFLWTTEKTPLEEHAKNYSSSEDLKEFDQNVKNELDKSLSVSKNTIDNIIDETILLKRKKDS